MLYQVGGSVFEEIRLVSLVWMDMLALSLSRTTDKFGSVTSIFIE